MAAPGEFSIVDISKLPPEDRDKLMSLIQSHGQSAPADPGATDGADDAEVELSFYNWALLWVNRNTPEIEAKAREYGSNSLMEMGRLFRRAQGVTVIPDAEAIEVGSFLYAYGKMQRVADAMLRGDTPKIDQWHDTAVYSLMAMFTREKGSWP